MYVHPSHRFNDRRDILALIESHPLGAWVCPTPQGLIANHVPFLLDRSRGEHGTLVAHVSRANPVWRALPHAGPSIVLFRGPQAYITPNWYPTKTTHGQVVPTWDYVAANVHGTARAIDDINALRDLVERLTQRHESGQPTPWKITDAPGRYIDKMLRAIVGIEIPIDRIEAKLKASQDEAMDDRLGTVQGLGSVNALSTGSDEAQQMADWVRRAINAQTPDNAA